MSEHTPLPVHGYQQQPQSAVDQVNHNKLTEEHILRQLDMMTHNSRYDQRWLAIARTQIEQGFMAWNRAIFRPARVNLEQTVVTATDGSQIKIRDGGP